MFFCRVLNPLRTTAKLLGLLTIWTAGQCGHMSSRVGTPSHHFRLRTSHDDTAQRWSQAVYTYTYKIQDIKRQVGKTPPISILMSGKTIYRLWQTINWLWSENWNINNIQPGRLHIIIICTVRVVERPKNCCSWTTLISGLGSFNPTLWSQSIIVNKFAASAIIIINFF